jgi:hypothetical protein
MVEGLCCSIPVDADGLVKGKRGWSLLNYLSLKNVKYEKDDEGI